MSFLYHYGLVFCVLLCWESDERLDSVELEDVEELDVEELSLLLVDDSEVVDWGR